MLDPKVFRLIREHDFMRIGALDLRPYEWGSVHTYNEAVGKRMTTYSSKYDLLHWFGFWTEQYRLMSPFNGIKEYESYKEVSSRNHETVLKQVFSTYKKPTPEIHAGYDAWNAIDAHIVFQNCPSTRTILDYGAGYGRLGLIFGADTRVKNYIAIDSIEVSYILQNLTLSSYKPNAFYEYFDYSFENKAFPSVSETNGFFHLPMWQWNLIPAASVDVACAVFVLPEINEFALKEAVLQFKRTIKPGGHLYVRDHLYHTGEKNHVGGHRLNTEELLAAHGFTKVYQPEYADNKDIYGTPRIYRLAK